MATLRQMWFGNTNYAGWCPVPETSMVKTDEGYAEEFAADNGGLVLANSSQSISRSDNLRDDPAPHLCDLVR